MTTPATEHFASVEELIRHRYSFDKSSQHLASK